MLNPRDLPSRTNNFDLIRLLAALQVALVHGYEHLRLRGVYPLLDAVIAAIAHLPEVPIFFTVSGFLISWSYERNPRLCVYARNQLLRIYPGLWLALAVTVTILLCEGFITARNAISPPMLAWFVGQLTVAQFYTPSALRGYGLGNPNGSLWTIAVEVQFYVMVPLIALALRCRKVRANAILAAMFLASLAANVWIGGLEQTSVTTKLLEVTLAPYLFFFLTGILAYRNWAALDHLFVERFPYWLTAFVAYAVVVGHWLRLYHSTYWPSPYSFVEALLLVGLVLSGAFTRGHYVERPWRGT